MSQPAAMHWDGKAWKLEKTAEYKYPAPSPAELTRERLVRALNDGVAADREGAELTSCPYPLRSSEWSAWVRGYAKTARLPGKADR